MERRAQSSNGNAPRLLLVDDNTELQATIAPVLERSGYGVQQVLSGQQALSAIQDHTFDAVLLELSLPDMDGLDVLTNVRQVSIVPVLVLTARSVPNDLEASFTLGADDYILKPCDPAQLIERLARYASPPTAEGKTIGRFRLRTDRHLLDKDGQAIILTQLESKLLDCLLASPDQSVATRTLFQAAWPPSEASARQRLHMVETAVVQLQNKIEVDPKQPRFITQVRGGYRFTPDSHDLASEAARLPS